MNIVLIGDRSRSRNWEHALITRLLQAEHKVCLRDGATSKSGVEDRLDVILGLEQRRFGVSLASRVDPLVADAPSGTPDLVIDLTGNAVPQEAPVLTIAFSGQASFAAGMAEMLASGTLPELVTKLDGEPVGIARPMLGDRLWLSRAGTDILAGALSLIEQGVVRFGAGALRPLAERVSAAAPRRHLLRHYVPFFVAGMAQRAMKKLKRGRPFYWQVAYRRVEGPGIAETGRLDGAPFTTLPDDGERFYADPFVVARNGQHFLFVEEYPYAGGKGIISVSELGADGRFGVPRAVLEEPYHLSYPQVFEDSGEIYMLPESGGAGRLVLYRAEQFPDRWAIDTVLIEGKDINDATLLVRDGRYWLFCTERRGVGSASDTMCVYGADSLRGPWLPHKLNPIAIDRAGARPGGAFIGQGDDLTLPVQDGTHAYGGGLGLMTLTRLDDEDVEFGPVRAVAMGAAWARGGIHTLNRAGAIEVVDSAG